MAPDGMGGNGEAGESPALSRNCNQAFELGSQVDRLCRHRQPSPEGMFAEHANDQQTSSLRRRGFLLVKLRKGEGSNHVE